MESCKVGMRKPEGRIFEHVIKLLDVNPEEVIFLDDLGHNLKPAREMGIRTIKVKRRVLKSIMYFTLNLICLLYHKNDIFIGKSSKMQICG